MITIAMLVIFGAAATISAVVVAIHEFFVVTSLLARIDNLSNELAKTRAEIITSASRHVRQV